MRGGGVRFSQTPPDGAVPDGKNSPKTRDRGAGPQRDRHQPRETELDQIQQYPNPPLVFIVKLLKAAVSVNTQLSCFCSSEKPPTLSQDTLRSRAARINVTSGPVRNVSHDSLRTRRWKPMPLPHNSAPDLISITLEMWSKSLTTSANSSQSLTRMKNGSWNSSLFSGKKRVKYDICERRGGHGRGAPSTFGHVTEMFFCSLNRKGLIYRRCHFVWGPTQTTQSTDWTPLEIIFLVSFSP